MFILSLTYIAPLDQVDALLDDHVAWIKAEHKAGNFLAWGRKVPRDGGMIFARADSKTAAEEIAAGDPFVVGGVARVEVTEFVPSYASEGLEGLSQ